MSIGRRGEALLRLAAATSCWGVSSAVLAVEVSDLASAAPVVALGAGATLWTVALLRGREPHLAFRLTPALYMRLGGLEALNLALFVGALRVGPLPVVVALHLTSPLILIIADVVRRRRLASVSLAVELALIAVAISLVTVAQPGTTSAGDVLIGSALALGSAVVLALLITQVAREAGSADPDVAASLQLSLAGLLSFPLLLFAPPPASSVGWFALVGLVLLGPGFALYWRALRDVDAPIAGIVGLNEAVVASLVGAVVFGAEVAVTAIAAAALILCAIGLELRRRDRRPHEGLAGP